MKFSMYKRSSLVEQGFLFGTENWEEQLKKPPSKFIFKSDIQPEIVKHLKIAEITEPVKI